LAWCSAAVGRSQVARDLGLPPQTLRRRAAQAEMGAGRRDGLSAAGCRRPGRARVAAKRQLLDCA